MSTKELDNSNPTVHATVSQAHTEKPASQSALLAGLWKTSNDEPLDQEDDTEWIKQAATQEAHSSILNRSQDAEREDIDELEVFGERRLA